MLLSIIIPCRDEENSIKNTIEKISNELPNTNYEIILINDFSKDNTAGVMNEISNEKTYVKFYNNQNIGLGSAINIGINNSLGKYVVIVMADLSEEVSDIKKYLDIALRDEALDAVFGSRFIKGSNIENYPFKKLILNRVFNLFVKILFFSDYNDFTNAFKLYKKDALIQLLPIVSENFNVFLELPLKIISRNFQYHIIDISWKNRKIGKSKFDIKELKSKYFFTLIYCFLEKHLLKKRKLK